MSSLEIILPILLIFITYILKLFIDQVVDLPAAIKSVCELPIDIVFLSISLLIAIVISNASNRNVGLVCMLANFIAAVLIIFLSKRSASNFISGTNNQWRIFLSLNMFISIMSLCISISMLTPVVEKKAQQTTSQNK